MIKHRASLTLNDSKGFGLNETRSSFNLRPTTQTHSESVTPADAGRKSKPSKIDFLFDSGVMNAVQTRKASNSLFLGMPLLKLKLGRNSKSGTSKKAIMTDYEANKAIESKIVDIKSILTNANKVKPNAKKSHRKSKFMSFFAQSNFAEVDYSLTSKDKLIKRLFLQLDFSLLRLIAYLADKMPNAFYKLNDVMTLFDKDFRCEKDQRHELVVTKDTILYQFMPKSQILRMKLFNKSRIDELKKSEFSLKTQTLISEVLKKSFNE
jgi:hypothetical protein